MKNFANESRTVARVRENQSVPVLTTLTQLNVFINVENLIFLALKAMII